MARPCGSGRVYRRGGSWWVASCIDGKEIREPGGRTQRKASKRLRDRVSQGDDYAPGQDRITVKGIIEDYLLHRRGIRSIDKLHCHAAPPLVGLGDRRAVRVTSSDVDGYVAGREALGRARATINRELELLRAAYRHAVGEVDVGGRGHGRGDRDPPRERRQDREGPVDRGGWPAARDHGTETGCGACLGARWCFTTRCAGSGASR